MLGYTTALWGSREPAQTTYDLSSGLWLHDGAQSCFKESQGGGGCRLTAVCGLGACRYDLNDMYSLKMQTQVASEKSFSQMMADVDVKGGDWQGQVSNSPVSSYFYRRALRYYSHAGKVPATGEAWKQRLLRHQLHSERHPDAIAGW